MWKVGCSDCESIEDRAQCHTVGWLFPRWAASGAGSRQTLTFALTPHPHTQPLHFGAVSGMGLCHLQLGEQEEALAAFEMALRIHPGLEDIRRIAGDLRAQQQQQQ